MHVLNDSRCISMDGPSAPPHPPWTQPGHRCRGGRRWVREWVSERVRHRKKSRKLSRNQPTSLHKSIHPSIDQSVIQCNAIKSINQSINQFIDQGINPWMNEQLKRAGGKTPAVLMTGGWARMLRNGGFCELTYRSLEPPAFSPRTLHVILMTTGRWGRIIRNGGFASSPTGH